MLHYTVLFYEMCEDKNLDSIPIDLWYTYGGIYYLLVEDVNVYVGQGCD